VPVLRESPAGAFLRYPHWLLRAFARSRLLIVSWFHEPLPVIEKLDIPMLWVLGGKDIEAPNEVTIAELERLRAAGKPIDLKIYPDADHGIVEFEEKDGERAYTRYSPGYFALESEWVRRQEG
jgi:dienelactone hydrolase